MKWIKSVQQCCSHGKHKHTDNEYDCDIRPTSVVVVNVRVKCHAHLPRRGQRLHVCMRIACICWPHNPFAGAQRFATMHRKQQQPAELFIALINCVLSRSSLCDLWCSSSCSQRQHTNRSQTKKLNTFSLNGNWIINSMTVVMLHKSQRETHLAKQKRDRRILSAVVNMRMRIVHCILTQCTRHGTHVYNTHIHRAPLSCCPVHNMNYRFFSGFGGIIWWMRAQSMDSLSASEQLHLNGWLIFLIGRSHIHTMMIFVQEWGIIAARISTKQTPGTKCSRNRMTHTNRYTPMCGAYK